MHGRGVRSPETVEGGQAVTAMPDDDGAPAAALVHDPALRDDEELLDAVCALVDAALEHERLAERARDVAIRARGLAQSGSPGPPTPSARGSSATSTTARSSG